jgi:hypothetical protein
VRSDVVARARRTTLVASRRRSSPEAGVRGVVLSPGESIVVSCHDQRSNNECRMYVGLALSKVSEV